VEETFTTATLGTLQAQLIQLKKTYLALQKHSRQPERDIDFIQLEIVYWLSVYEVFKQSKQFNKCACAVRKRSTQTNQIADLTPIDESSNRSSGRIAAFADRWHCA
jgi:ribosome-binding ATPase YchF (GTP1/OBG family)